MKKIEYFKGEYDFLSNFYESPVMYDGRLYANSEGAFHSMKSLDPSVRNKFKDLNPSLAKKLGRSVVLRSDWDEVKDGIMKEIVKAKFVQNKDLTKKLLATGDAELIEGNWWGDRYWGVCEGTGKNMLGKILMEVRNEINDFTNLL